MPDDWCSPEKERYSLSGQRVKLPAGTVFTLHCSVLSPQLSIPFELIAEI